MDSKGVVHNDSDYGLVDKEKYTAFGTLIINVTVPYRPDFSQTRNKSRCDDKLKKKGELQRRLKAELSTKRAYACWISQKSSRLTTHTAHK